MSIAATGRTLGLFYDVSDADLLRGMPTGIHLPDDLGLNDYLSCPS